ncbi:hypothetical protein C8Q76DRAFT_703395 [Earliella scabrosa]|nr:hypothetical protein C8Q76DRAFT_703395 [Earliella scabrosa]
MESTHGGREDQTARTKNAASERPKANHDSTSSLETPTQKLARRPPVSTNSTALVEKGVQAESSPTMRQSTLTGASSRSEKSSGPRAPASTVTTSSSSSLSEARKPKAERSSTAASHSVSSSKSTPSMKSSDGRSTTGSPKTHPRMPNVTSQAAAFKVGQQVRDKKGEDKATANTQRKDARVVATADSALEGEKRAEKSMRTTSVTTPVPPKPEDKQKATRPAPQSSAATIITPSKPTVPEAPATSAKRPPPPPPPRKPGTSPPQPSRSVPASSAKSSGSGAVAKPAPIASKVEKVKALADFTAKAVDSPVRIPVQEKPRTIIWMQRPLAGGAVVDRHSDDKKPAPPSERSSVVSYATMIVPPAATSQPPAAPPSATSQKTQQAVTPMAEQTVVGSSARNKDEVEDDFESPFGRTKPLRDLQSLTTSNVGMLGKLQNPTASLSQVDVMKPSLVQHRSVSSLKGSVVSQKVSPASRKIAVINFANATAASISSSEERLEDPFASAGGFTTFPNSSDSTLSTADGPSRPPSRAPARASSAGSTVRPRSTRQRRASAGESVAQPAEPPPAYSKAVTYRYNGGTEYALYDRGDKKLPAAVALSRSLHQVDGQWPRPPVRDSVQAREFAQMARWVEVHQEELDIVTGKDYEDRVHKRGKYEVPKGGEKQDKPNVFSKAISGFKLKALSKRQPKADEAVFQSCPPDVGPTGK